MSDIRLHCYWQLAPVELKAHKVKLSDWKRHYNWPHEVVELGRFETFNLSDIQIRHKKKMQ